MIRDHGARIGRHGKRGRHRGLPIERWCPRMHGRIVLELRLGYWPVSLLLGIAIVPITLLLRRDEIVRRLRARWFRGIGAIARQRHVVVAVAVVARGSIGVVVKIPTNAWHQRLVGGVV